MARSPRSRTPARTALAARLQCAGSGRSSRCEGRDKPRHHRLIVLKSVDFVDTAYEGLLQDILGPSLGFRVVPRERRETLCDSAPAWRWQPADVSLRTLRRMYRIQKSPSPPGRWRFSCRTHPRNARLSASQPGAEYVSRPIDAERDIVSAQVKVSGPGVVVEVVAGRFRDARKEKLVRLLPRRSAEGWPGAQVCCQSSCSLLRPGLESA